MNDWALLIGASLVGSLFSLIGGVLLLTKRISAHRVQRVAIPFAAGALLAAALLDLLPEALEHGESPVFVMSLVLFAFVVFFVLERFLGWFHHHHDHPNQQVGSESGNDISRKPRSTGPLIIIGDVLHNTIDGMVIGAAFLADPLVGIITTIAIAAHEIPQEIGDFGVLLSLGMRRKTVLFVNLFSAFATVIGAMLVYGLGSAVTSIEPILLAIAAGMFIYIAASDLVPSIHEEPSVRVANYQTLILLFGIVLVGITTTTLHGVIENPSAPDEGFHAAESHAHE